MTPPHLVIIFSDDVLRIGKPSIAREHSITAQVSKIAVLPEYPYGDRIENPFRELL